MSTHPVSPNISTLEELGLAKNEAVLYDALLKTTDATIPYLLKTVSFSRTLLYYLLGNLEGYSLVTTANKSKGDGRKTVYNAEPPDKLADMLKDREAEFKKQKDLLGGIMGDLYSTYRLAHNKPGVKFYEGETGFKEITYDSLNATETIYTFADAEAVSAYVKELNVEFVKERKKRGIKKHIIALDTPFSREHYKNANDEFTEVRLIDKKIPAFETGTHIYNDTVSFITLRADSKIGIIIKDSAIAKMHRSMFEYIWSTLPTMKKPETVKPPARATEFV